MPKDLDGTEGQQDTTSAETTGTSEENLETFTREQVEESARKAKSDALSEIGRYKKSADSAIKATQAVEERINRMLKEQEDAELEAARDEPDALRSIRAKQTARAKEADLTKRERELGDNKAEHEEALKAMVEFKKEQNALEIAIKHDVPFEKLLKFTDGSKEAMEDLAKDLPKKGETKTLIPDSGKTIGGGRSFKQLEQSYAEGKISTAEYETALKGQGKI